MGAARSFYFFDGELGFYYFDNDQMEELTLTKIELEGIEMLMLPQKKRSKKQIKLLLEKEKGN